MPAMDNRLGAGTRLLSVVVLASLLSGCAALRGNTGQHSETADIDHQSRLDRHRQQVAAITRFDVSGGFGFWTDDEQLSTRLTWRQRGEDLAIDVIAPMAAGSLAVKREGGVSTIQRGEQSISSRASLDSLLQEALELDVRVPVSQMSDWLRGLPGDGQDLDYDDTGRLVALRLRDDAGRLWQARFRRYETVDGVDLPALITAVSKPYHVRLVLRHWQLGNPAGETPLPDSDPSPDASPEPAPSRLHIPGRRA